MNEQLKTLENEIFKPRPTRRISLIREAWAAYMATLDPPDTLGRRVVDWLKRSVGL